MTEKTIRETIRENLDAFIAESGISKIEIARRLGVHRCNVTNWTNGKTSPDVERLARLAELLGRPTSAFFGERAGTSPEEEAQIRELVDAFRALDERRRAETLEFAKNRGKKNCGKR